MTLVQTLAMILFICWKGSALCPWYGPSKFNVMERWPWTARMMFNRIWRHQLNHNRFSILELWSTLPISSSQQVTQKWQRSQKANCNDGVVAIRLRYNPHCCDQREHHNTTICWFWLPTLRHFSALALNILDGVHFFHFQALNLSHDGLIVKAGQKDGSDRTLLANHVPLHNYRSIYCQGLILIKSHESACVLIKHPISHVGILTWGRWRQGTVAWLEVAWGFSKCAAMLEKWKFHSCSSQTKRPLFW